MHINVNINAHYVLLALISPECCEGCRSFTSEVVLPYGKKPVLSQERNKEVKRKLFLKWKNETGEKKKRSDEKVGRKETKRKPKTVFHNKISKEF